MGKAVLFQGALLVEDQVGAVKFFNGVLHVLNEVVGHPHPEVGADDDPLDFNLVEVLGQWVGRHLPALHCQTIGQVVEGPLVILVLLVAVADNRQAATVVDDFKEAELFDLLGQVNGDVVGPLVDVVVAFKAVTDEVLILSDDLRGPAGEVDRHRWHLATQVGNPEDQLFGHALLFAPQNPANTGVHQAVLVTGGVDRYHVSIRINAQFRICFKVIDHNKFVNIEIIDYH